MTSRILHVSGDFPDTIAPFKTPVIKSFLELTADAFNHRVVSINRASPGARELTLCLLGKPDIVRNEQPFEFGTALEYSAPGRGLFHRTMLERLGEHLAELIKAQDDHVDLIVGHKLTIERHRRSKGCQACGATLCPYNPGEH